MADTVTAIDAFNDTHATAVDRTWSSLCDCCRKIFTISHAGEVTEDDGPAGTHHGTIDSCKQAVARGCPICRIVWFRATEGDEIDISKLDSSHGFTSFSIQRNGSPYLPNAWSKEQLVLRIGIGKVIRARNLGFIHTLAYGNVTFGIEQFSGMVSSYGSVDSAQNICLDEAASSNHQYTSSNTSSTECWGLLEEWMRQCRDTCEPSCKNTNESWTPTRLLDVGEADAPNLILITTQDRSGTVPYLSLSHSWGGNVQCMLYDASKEWQRQGGIALETALQYGIAIDTLPLSFRDAIHITRRLGYRYLWVDCLCILQNSKEDWEREASQMADLYTFADCTLIADGAKDSLGGLYHDRNPVSVAPMTVSALWPGELSESCKTLVPEDFWQELIVKSRTGRRGWALQERFLAGRKIHFGATQLAWECQGFEACETFPRGLPQSLQADSNFGTGKLRVAERSIETENEEPGEHRLDEQSTETYLLWAKLIERYQRTKLTFESDKLAAIHGLSYRFQSALQNIHLGGLWFNTLASQLLWQVDIGYNQAIFVGEDNTSYSSPKPPASRAEHSVAPSWSWASIIGPVMMANPLDRGALVELRVSGQQGTDLNDLSFHRDMILATWGTLHLGEMAWTKNDKWVLRMSRRGYSNRVGRSVETQLVSADQPGDIDNPSPGLGMDDLLGLAQPDTDSDVPSTGYDGEGYVKQSVQVWCLPVLDTGSSKKFAHHPNPGFQLNGISGLLLMPLAAYASNPAMEDAPSLSGFYRRIGIFHLMGDKDVNLEIVPGMNELFVPGDDKPIMLV